MSMGILLAPPFYQMSQPTWRATRYPFSFNLFFPYVVKRTMLFPLDRKSWTLTSEQCWCFSTSTFAGGNFWPSSYLHGGVFITPLFLSIRLLIAWYGDINIQFFCPSQYQANSFEEAINIVNRNKYFLKFSSLVVYITILFLILLKKYYMWFVCDLYFWNRYGNGASIFTTSGVAARKFQTEIEAGQVRVTSSIIMS